MVPSVVRTRQPRRQAAAPGHHLPLPPSDAEKYWYFGRQHRWLLALQSLAFVSIGVSVVRFSLSDDRVLLVLAPFSLMAVALVVSLLSSTRGARLSRTDHELRVIEYQPQCYPSVDVFLPTAGEPLEVLANTYRFVHALRWPGRLDVWVLDDAARAPVRELAQEHGFEYRTRPDRGRLKKAGNLRFGFESTENDLIVIFDADFVPRADFLHELVPYFEDADVGIVQSPQFFDARRGMSWLQRCAGATQELFYRWIQRARDRSDAAICVGTCAVYRRSALDAAGGFAQIGHSEDVHTGVQVLRAGYRLRYVPALLSKGLCPDTALAFVTQQYRWCTGSMSLLADRRFHDDPTLSVRQKLSFWAGFLYYITTAINVFLTAVPGLVMLWVLPQFVLPRNSVWLIGALLMWFVVLPVMMRGRWRVDVLRVQALYSFAHATAIYHVLARRTEAWVPTGTADARPSGTPLGTKILRLAKCWVVVTQLGLWGGLAHATLTHGVRNTWAMMGLAALAAYVQLPLLLLPGGQRAARRDVRSRLTARLHSWRRRRATIFLPGTSGYRPPRAPAAVGLRTFRPDIQGLRAVAVLLVVLYHAHVPLVRGGYVGVDVFFVISGFLITGGLLRQVERTGRIGFRTFYARRFRRLAVPAVIVTLVTLLGARAWDSLFQVRTVAMDALSAGLYVVNYRFAAQGVNYQLADGPESPLQHYWSLAVEEQFYATWPLLIMLCVWALRRRRRGRRTTIAVVLALVTVGSLLLNLRLTHSDQPMAYFSLQTRAWELGAGALLACAALSISRMPAWSATCLSWAGLAAVVWSGVTLDDTTLFPGLAAVLPVLGAAAIIAAGCRPTRRGAELLLNRRPMQGLGTVSYSWYLWHWPILIIFPMLLQRRLAWPVQLELAALSLWVATLMYMIVERPMLRTRLRRWWLAAGPAFAASVGATSVLVAASVPSLVGTGAAVHLAANDTGAVMHAVAVGTLTQAAPSNLRPALATIRSDQPQSTLNGCHAGFLDVRQGRCEYGDPQGRHTMVLLGDSHAQQWLPALDREAKLLGWRLITWTKSACPIADVTLHAEQLGNRVYTECEQWRKITVARVQGVHPDVVAVSQSDNVPGKQLSNAAWADATASTLMTLRRGGVPVIYILDTPVPRSNVPDCVANHLDKVEPCMFRRKDAYAFPGRHEQMKDTLDAIGVTSLEPVDWFCTARKCPVVVGDRLVYRDASHMSTPYSRFLAPATRPLFVPRTG